jgi:hypothetical protein
VCNYYIVLHHPEMIEICVYTILHNSYMECITKIVSILYILIHGVQKNYMPELREVIGVTTTKIYCQETVCWSCVLAVLRTIRVGLTKVRNKAKLLKYSEEKYLVPIYSRCSNARPPTSIHGWQQRSIDWRVCSKVPGCCVIVAAASPIRPIRSSSESTGDVQINGLVWPHNKKSIGVRFGKLGGQATGPPRPIQRSF